VLRWSGALSPAPAVTATLALPGRITNTAMIAAPGYPAIARTATIMISARRSQAATARTAFSNHALAPDALVISELKAELVTPFSAVVTWTTNNASDSRKHKKG
jgi:hypothetical protein